MLKDGAKDLENIDKLMDQTKKKLKIVESRLQQRAFRIKWEFDESFQSANQTDILVQT